MSRFVLAVIAALALSQWSHAVFAADLVVEVPETAATGKATVDGEVQSADSAAAAEGVAQPEATFFRGCFGRFGSRTISLRARGRITYRVVPTTFFDVTMNVNYVGRGSFFVDRFFAPGAEQITIRGPNFFVPVRVTIRGFNGQAGCYVFTSNP